MTRAIATVVLSASLVFASTVTAQEQTPVFTFDSMMNSYFDDSTGQVSFGDYMVAFAPPAPFQGAAVVADAKSIVLASFKFFPDYQFNEQVFGRVRIQGPADHALTEPAVYSLVFLIDGKPVSRLPFLLKQTGAGDDPFNPAKTYAFDGYWRTFAYLTYGTYDEEKTVELHCWIGGLDLPEGKTKDAYFVELKRNGEVVAYSKRTLGHIAQGHFEYQKLSLFHPHTDRQTPNAELFMAKDWEVDGDYEVLFTRTSDGAMIRSYNFTSSGGKIQPHPRSALDYEPRVDFIAPRVQKRGSNMVEMIEAVWIEDR